MLWLRAIVSIIGAATEIPEYADAWALLDMIRALGKGLD
jgi:hypothetical protein